MVGAQNAGKSSIINRLSRMYGGPGPEDGGPLASHLPRTTLGVVRLENLLPNGSDVFDTPGLLQLFQVSSRLDNEEARMVLPRRRLQPRTYRAEIGSTIHIGGLARIDVVDGPQRTMYLTVWVSGDVPTHYMVKGDGGKADALFAKHAGGKLSPPAGEKRVRQMGEWGSRTVDVYGSSWQKSDRDITVGGLGWIGVGVNGNASFRVWTHEGVQVATREGAGAGLGEGSPQTGVLERDVRWGGGEQQAAEQKGEAQGRLQGAEKKVNRGVRDPGNVAGETRDARVRIRKEASLAIETPTRRPRPRLVRGDVWSRAGALVRRCRLAARADAEVAKRASDRLARAEASSSRGRPSAAARARTIHTPAGRCGRRRGFGPPGKPRQPRVLGADDERF